MALKKAILETRLAAPLDEVWQALKTPALLHYVARGMISFRAIEPPRFPEEWSEGEYRVAMRLFGVLPLGWQVIRIEIPPPDGDALFVRDNGRGPMIKTWDHLITVKPDGAGGVLYTDSIAIDAGALTGVIAAFAARFYAHRQARWRKLTASGRVDFESLGLAGAQGVKR